jgi:hypothetical protein
MGRLLLVKSIAVTNAICIPLEINYDNSYNRSSLLCLTTIFPFCACPFNKVKLLVPTSSARVQLARPMRLLSEKL